MDERCSRCGKDMVEEGRQIDRIIPGGFLRIGRVVYRITLICPQRTGFWGAFRGAHDRKIISEECTDD